MTLDLAKYGITDVKQVVHNPSYEQLHKDETAEGLVGYEKGVVTELGAMNVMTGIYTGRSPKDKFFVVDDVSKDTVWWTSEEYKNDNKPLSEASWKILKDKAIDELSHKDRLYVVDAFCGANKNTRLKVRFIMEVAWQAHFVTNMFIRPTPKELEDFGEPDFVVLTASKAKVENYKELGLHSETAVVFNLKEKMQVILNTWYGGEMKKGMFSVMNYLNPLRHIASMHCSANTDLEGKNTAIFFGLSGTGKTTLSTDPKRLLIGDDEHGWDDEAFSITRAGATPKSSIWIKKANRIFTTPSAEMLSWKTSSLMKPEKSISATRPLQKTLVFLIRSITSKTSLNRSPKVLPPRKLFSCPRTLTAFCLRSRSFLQTRQCTTSSPATPVN